MNATDSWKYTHGFMDNHFENRKVTFQAMDFSINYLHSQVIIMNTEEIVHE